jgi:hypothetical protein
VSRVFLGLFLRFLIVFSSRFFLLSFRVWFKIFLKFVVVYNCVSWHLSTSMIFLAPCQIIVNKCSTLRTNNVTLCL